MKPEALWTDGRLLLNQHEHFLSRWEIHNIQSRGAGGGSLAYLTGKKNAQTGFQKQVPTRRGLNAQIRKPRAERARALTRSGSKSVAQMGNVSLTLARALSSAQCCPGIIIQPNTRHTGSGNSQGKHIRTTTGPLATGSHLEREVLLIHRARFSLKVSGFHSQSKCSQGHAAG